MAANGKVSGNGGFILLITALISMLRAPIVVCSASNQGGKNPAAAAAASLQVIHRLRLREDGGGGVDRATMMSELARQPARRSPAKGANLPAKVESSVLGTHSVVVWLGSKKTPLSLVMDTGSDMMWTQCQPCQHGCYHQRGQIFDPATSSTYSEVLCNTTTCDVGLLEATGQPGVCFASSSIPSDKAPNKCNYYQQYGEANSHSAGIMAGDSLTLSRDLTLSGIIFGCGQDNNLSPRDNAGVMGLGKGSLSIVSQTWDTFGGKFSYCLPTEKEVAATPAGHLTLGGLASPYAGVVKYTNLVTMKEDPYSYYVTVLGMNVSGESIIMRTSTAFLVDSGSSISVLPRETYQALNSSFASHMVGWPRAQGDGTLDICYDLREVDDGKIPEVSFVFGGGVVVQLGPASLMLDLSQNADRSAMCLAFAPAAGDGVVPIFGSYQQQTLEMAYDVAGGKLGFGQNGCT